MVLRKILVLVEMEMTLEELLANDGFKRTASNLFWRAPFGSFASSVPHSTHRDLHKSGPFSDVRKTERTKSDLQRYSWKDESPPCDRTRGRRPRDNLRLREKLDRELKKETREQFGRDSNDLNEFNSRSSRDSSEDSPGNEIGVEDGEGCEDVFSNKVHSPDRSNHKYSTGISASERPKRRSGKDIEDSKAC